MDTSIEELLDSSLTIPSFTQRVSSTELIALTNEHLVPPPNPRCHGDADVHIHSEKSAARSRRDFPAAALK